MTLGRSPEKQTLGKKNLEQSGFSFKKKYGGPGEHMTFVFKELCSWW